MTGKGLSQAEIDALFSSGSEAEAPESAQPATFPSLDPGIIGPSDPNSIGLLANVEMEVSVHLGETRRSIRDILSLGPGSVLELDRLAGESVDIMVNNRLVAKGEIVVIGENFGVRITELIQKVSPAGKAK